MKRTEWPRPRHVKRWRRADHADTLAATITRLVLAAAPLLPLIEAEVVRQATQRDEAAE